MIITIERKGADGTWHAWFDDAPEHGWVPTPFFGPATFAQVAARLQELNPGALIAASLNDGS